MTASQHACQTTNTVLVVATLTQRARLSATRLLMNVKTGVHAFITVLKGVILWLPKFLPESGLP